MTDTSTGAPPIMTSDEVEAIRRKGNMGWKQIERFAASHEALRAVSEKLVAATDFDVEAAIAEAIAVMPKNTDYCEAGVPVLKHLKALGYIIMEDKGHD